MDVRRILAGTVHRANAHEAHRRPGLRVIAPDRYLAVGAASDPLSSAAGRRRLDELRLGLQVFDTVCFVERIERMSGAGLALAPGAMAGMNDQRFAGQTISDMSASAAAFHDHAPAQCFPAPIYPNRNPATLRFWISSLPSVIR